MAGVALRRLAILALVAYTPAAEEATIEERIAALREQVKAEDSRLRRLELGSARRNRRLVDEEPSIHGSYDLAHREYTFEESFSGALTHTWLLLAGTMVMFMQAGFAMVEAGVCRAKNVQSILLKNLTDVATGTFGWWIFGWAFAYGGPFDDDGLQENNFAGRQQFAGVGFMTTLSDGQFEPSDRMVNWYFQWAFCATAATIVSGGVAERVNFWGYLIFSMCMTTFIYPIIVAWTWGYGFLVSFNASGYIDFAGSGIVHMTGGVAALVGAAICGPRRGRFPDDYSVMQRVLDAPEKFDPHSQPLIVLGTFILWFGWYGFNCGSTLAMDTIEKGYMAGHVAMNTTLSASCGGLVVFILRFAMLRRYDINGLCNGILAGLVSITAGCGNMEHGSAVLTGVLGGFLCQGASTLVRIVKVDDPIDAFAVHGMCGMWGVFAAAFFDWGDGFKVGHGWSGFRCIMNDDGTCNTDGMGNSLLLANFVEVLCIGAWAGILAAILFFILKAVNMLRLGEDIEKMGIDKEKHSPLKAYAGDQAEENFQEEPLNSI